MKEPFEVGKTEIRWKDYVAVEKTIFVWKDIDVVGNTNGSWKDPPGCRVSAF